MQPSFYDFSPVFRMLVTGLLVASGPLLWVYLRNRRTHALGMLHALTLVTLFLTFDLVMFGAFTRLTDSGLAALTGQVLRKCKPTGCEQRDRRSAESHAHWSRHARQGVGSRWCTAIWPWAWAFSSRCWPVLPGWVRVRANWAVDGTRRCRC